MKKNWLDFQRYIHFVAARFVQDRCSQTAASLTFTTLLSLVPLITIALTLFSAFPVFADFSAQIKTFLLGNLMPDTGGKNITKYMQQFTESAARLTAVGISFLAITAMWMMLTIDKAFNVIWRVSRSRPLFKRLVIYWAVLTLAPLLVGAIRILRIMAINLRDGKVTSFPALSKKLCLGYDTLEEMLEVLEQADIVRKAEGQGWLMMREASHIKVNELLRLYVLDRDALSTHNQVDPLQLWLITCIEQIEAGTTMTLQELFTDIATMRAYSSLPDKI